MINIDSFCLVIILVTFTKCQTLVLDIHSCIGVNSLKRKSEVIEFGSGSAYHLKTPEDGISLNNNIQSSSAEGCSYAFVLPQDIDFDYLSIFIKKAEVHRKPIRGDSLKILFYGDKGSTNPLADINLLAYKTPISNVYLNTRTWKSSAAIIYMAIVYTSLQQIRITTKLHLHFTLTPTYTCILSSMMTRGSYANSRTIYSSPWKILEELFHPGWLTCEDAVNMPNKGHIWMAPCINYHLTCDNFLNCPSYSTGLNGTGHMDFFKASLESADEETGGNVCFPPLLSVIPLPFIIFLIASLMILLLAIYLRSLGIYSPMFVLHFQHFCQRYCKCFCCAFCSAEQHRIPESSAMETISSSVSTLSLDDTCIPHSPPTYDSINNLHSETKRNHWCCSCCCDQKSKSVRNILNESGNSLPPDYSEVTEQVGVYPEIIISRLKILKGSTSRDNSAEMKESDFQLKPTPQLSQPVRTSFQNPLSSGFHSILFWSHNRQVMTSRSVQLGQSQNLPTYAEFISRDFKKRSNSFHLEELHHEAQTRCSNNTSSGIWEPNEIA